MLRQGGRTPRHRAAMAGAFDHGGAVILGLIPDFSALFRPVDTLQVVIDQTGEASPFWSEYISSLQRDQIIAAFGSAVGINMTFLLPYTLQKRGWTKKHRELSFFDLALGLFVPFIIATGCLIVVSATMFHARADDVLAEIDQENIGVAQSYQRVLDLRADWLDDADVTAPIGEADRQIGAMIFNRNAGQLAKALSPVLGEVGAQWIFGLGILAMAVSTIIIHQIMNGYAVSEAFNQSGNRRIFIAGALIPPIAGFFAPILWTGDAKIALIIPAAVTATTLLPLAYFAFFLLFNSKAALGPDFVTGHRRILANTLMILAGGIATFASIWALVGRLPSWGFGARAGLIALVALFVGAAIASLFMAWVIGAGSSGATPFAPAVGASAIPTTSSSCLMRSPMRATGRTYRIWRGRRASPSFTPISATSSA